MHFCNLPQFKNANYNLNRKKCIFLDGNLYTEQTLSYYEI